MFYQLIGLLLIFLLSFFLIRGIIKLHIESVMTKRQRKKIKYENFMDWIFYKQYQDILPKQKLFWYFLNFALVIIFSALIVVLTSLDLSGICNIILWLYLAVNGIWLIVQRVGLL